MTFYLTKVNIHTILCCYCHVNANIPNKFIIPFYDLFLSFCDFFKIILTGYIGLALLPLKRGQIAQIPVEATNIGHSRSKMGDFCLLHSVNDVLLSKTRLFHRCLLPVVDFLSQRGGAGLAIGWGEKKRATDQTVALLSCAGSLLFRRARRPPLAPQPRPWWGTRFCPET